MSAPHHTIRTSASGSLMLMGEHAVLHGHHALCGAVEKRIHVTLTPLDGRDVVIESDLGTAAGSLDQLPRSESLRFVLQAIRQLAPKRGFELTIRSDIQSTVGLGSSAAVSVATVDALRAYKRQSFNRAAVFEDALEVLHAVQGRGSGADLAAAVYGGIVLYRADPVSIEPIVVHPPLAAVYTGYKTPTAEVIEKVESRREQTPELFDQVFHTMDAATLAAVRTLRNGDWGQLGRLFDLHHGLQAALGSSDAVCESLVHALRRHEGVTGAKISGSGLGDCILALGKTDASVNGYESMPVRIDCEGLIRE